MAVENGNGGVPKYRTTEFSFNDLTKNGITVPKFQRGLVWSDSAKKSFIRTIANGFPFGTVLLYETGPGRYSIIDGLQRFSALKSFQKSPGSYWSKDNKSEWLPRLVRILKKYILEVSESNANKLFEDLVNSQRRNEESYPIFKKWFDLPRPQNIDGFFDEYQKFVGQLGSAISSFINLESVKIPAIIFTGTADELASVFENLNKTGTKLTKYQVFSASWQDKMLTLDDSMVSGSVLDILAKRYEDLQNKDYDRGLQIDDYDTDTFKNERKINLAEFAYALGTLILKKLPSLYKLDDGSSRDTVGFYALAIATGTDNRHLEDAINKIEIVRQKHNEILTKMVSIAENINEVFSRYLKKPTFKSVGSPSNSFENGMNSDLKLLSYIAAMWTFRDDPKDQRIMLKNIPAYFVVDDLKNTWSGSGDSRLSTYFKNSASEGKQIANYLIPLSKNSLRNTFDSWLEEENGTTSISFSARIKCLATIHANCTYASHIKPGSKVDFEHIIAKKLLSRSMNNGKALYVDQAVPGGTIGNVMLLNDANNREKQTSNLWEDAISESRSRGASEEIVKDAEYISLLSYPSKDDLRSAEEALMHGDASLAKDVIYRRGQAVMHSIAEELGM